jgi:A/G-specific adenine glycosylase
MSNIIEFQKTIIDYYKEHGRDLSWRKTSNSYHIVVSEIMLQQTQVPRVTIKYQEFLDRFPPWESLANATFAEVLEQWSGLGYNRRAKFLHQIAQKVVTEFNGVLPDDPIILETFPGIGKATAASIVVYAFGKPILFIETNVRRVFIYHFFKDKENISDKEIESFVESTLDKKNPKEWYWALMDYGTYLATQIENPNRKSKHYSKQSKFEGSVRKVRGEILRQLIKQKTMNKEQIYKLDSDNEKMDAAIKGLLSDKLITENSEKYSIRV